MGAPLSIHSCSLGAPILLEETTASGTAPAAEPVGATPACDGVKQIGQWNKAWDPFFNLDPMWTDQFMAAGAAIYGSGVFTAKAPGTISRARSRRAQAWRRSWKS